MAKELITLKGAATMYDPVVRGVVEQAKNVLLRTNPMVRKDLNEVTAKLQTEYASKVNELREIVARVRAVLRRSAAAPPATERADRLPPLSTDPRTRRAVAAGRALDLTRVEFDLLATLLGSPGRVFTRAELIDRVWGDGFRITDRTIDSHVKALRRKIADAGAEASWIETVRGVGYRLSDDPSTTEAP